MSPKREYFEAPVVRVETMKARFPRTCPVCGEPATNIVRLKIRKTDKIPLRPSFDYLSPRRQATRSSESKTLPVLVCEDHADPDAGTDRYQTLCIIIDGILLAFLFFGLLFIGDRLSRGRPMTFWPFLFIGLFAVAMLMTSVAFQPNALEKAVKIVGYDLGMRNVMIAFKNRDYRDEFMQENQMTAELVSWILKADT